MKLNLLVLTILLSSLTTDAFAAGKHCRHSDSSDNESAYESDHEIYAVLEALLFENNISKAKTLLSAINDINAVIYEHMRSTAVHVFCYFASIADAEINLVAALNFLVDNGLNLTARDSQHQTALHILCQSNDIDLDLFNRIKEIFEHQNAELLNFKDKHGRTYSHYAAINRHADCINHAHLHQPDNDNKTPFSLAIIMRVINKIINTPKTMTLHAAIKSNNFEQVIAHLAQGANLEEADEFARTPLLVAANNGHKEIVQSLIACGASVNAITEHGSPLHLAADNGHTEVVNMLIKAGADVHATNAQRNTPLYLAAFRKEAIVEALIAAGAIVDATNEDGATPLHMAASHPGNEAVVRALIRAGATVNATTNEDKATPLHMAASNPDNEAMVEALIAAGAAVNATTYQYRLTPLHIAARCYSIASVKMLLDAGAEVNAKDSENYTPLHLAARFNRLEIVRMLLDAGADKTLRNSLGETAVYESGFPRINTMIEQYSTRDPRLQCPCAQ